MIVKRYSDTDLKLRSSCLAEIHRIETEYKEAIKPYVRVLNEIEMRTPTTYILTPGDE